MLTFNDGAYSATYTYDALNRVTSLATTYPFGAKTVSYTYDKVGNKTTVTTPDIGTITYTYDILNRLTQVTSPTSEVTSYAYDNAGRLIKKTLPNGVYTDYTYDNVNRLTSLLNKKSDTTVISSFSYTHDKVGNRLSMTTTEGAHNYTYDSIYRLGSADHPVQPDETYTYDEVGNRLTSAVHPTWTYDINNRLTSYNGTTLTYDKNGNTLSKTEALGTTTYTYDYENRLKAVSSQSSAVSYSYDPFGKRLSKTVVGVTKYYLYDNEDIIAEYDSTGNLIASYIHGQGIDEPIQGLSPTGTVPEWFYTFDGLGSVSELTDASGTVVESYKYDAFGKLETPPTAGNPYTYTSREYDSETGLYYYRARYYDARVGRFITADPIGFEGGVNLYAYCSNNPINWIDPFGLDKQKQKTYWDYYWQALRQQLNEPAVISNRYLEEAWLRALGRAGAQFSPTPPRVLRWSGRVLGEFGYRWTGRLTGAIGVAIEPGGTGKLTGMIVGGTVLGGLGSSFGPVGAVGGGIVGGAIGGYVGSLFDYPGAGQLNYNEWERYEPY